ncbi:MULTISPECIES: Rieske 2Fe-2S domain-containing protein [Rhodococcus]|uniref:Rieske (2Fe-2S) protein n=1 Tax=Rhodococcus TaxID=1827 RepID=UPI000BD71EA4|nr:MULTISPECIES: Rieske 2Fe-2S domain-containing protein [unclassified Rhodococcus (in: high G+C Gram-positive bacteria)]PTR45419.1 nitrite reductase (NADH) small subunit [Rhodococcus sp. OK611]SNX88969.1 nitrite reductase (NADH) small subunit [Rhodococcus sp. OK270]
MTALHSPKCPEDATPTTLGAVTDLTPGEGRAYAIHGLQLAVFLLSDGTIRAMDAVCPHKGGPLADGQIDGGVVMCPLHQYAFSFDTGACTSEGVGAAQTYPARVVDGMVTVDI